MPTSILSADTEGIAQAASIMRKGGILAFPTETVYGLGGDAGNDLAVENIYLAKQRPKSNPLIVHVADLASAQEICHIPQEARSLVDKLWPGPLTLIAPLRTGANIAAAVVAGSKQIAVRVPSSSVAQALCRAFAGPIAAPSANLSGRLSPTCAEHVLETLSGRIDALIDGGACTLGLESTIVKFCQGRVQILREGAVTGDEIAEITGEAAFREGKRRQGVTPGSDEAHYAPRARVRLNASAPKADEAWLGFGKEPADCKQAILCENLSSVGDLREAAARLFACLHNLDNQLPSGGTIAVAPVPMVGLGVAINDRLRRAAQVYADRKKN